MIVAPNEAVARAAARMLAMIGLDQCLGYVDGAVLDGLDVARVPRPAIAPSMPRSFTP